MGANRSHDYVMNIDRCIDNFAASMNQFKGYETSFQQLKGNIAEHWHANTYNIDAVVKGSKSTASQETLDLLTDKLKSSDGIESISLSKAEAEKLAKLAKEGKYNPRECGFTTNELVKFEHIIKQGLKAGASAAAVALAISITQAIFQTASELHSNGYISDIDFKHFGLASAGAVGDSFIQASVTASLVTACASGKLGATLQTLNPSVISAAVIICINTVKDTIRMHQGKISGSELTTNIARNTAIVSATFAGGTLGANILTQMFASATQTIIPIPVIGYLIGSIIGSVIATYSCKFIGKKALSFCLDSGITFFGLVEQDYVLPVHIIKEMGTEVLNYEKLKYDYISQERLEYDSLEYETLDYERCGIQRAGSQELSFTFIRRGVIGFNRIGYIAQ